MEEPLFVTKRYNSSTISLIVFGCIFLFIAFIVFLVHVVNTLDIGITLIAIVGCILLAIYQFLSVLWATRIYNVYDDRVVALSFFGKEKQIVKRNEIKKWAEFQRKGRSNTVVLRILKLYTDAQTYTIRDSNLGHTEYQKLKELITKDLPEDLSVEANDEKRQGVIAAIIIVVVIVAVVVFMSLVK